jgi:hypothetical protein
MIARASVSERTLGRRLRLGARTLFLRKATTRGRVCGQREIGSRYDVGGTYRGPRRADREDPADSYAPPPRSVDLANDDSVRTTGEPLGCSAPVSRLPTPHTSCPRSFSHATRSSRSSSARANRDPMSRLRTDTLDRFTRRGSLPLRRSRSVQCVKCTKCRRANAESGSYFLLNAEMLLDYSNVIERMIDFLAKAADVLDTRSELIELLPSLGALARWAALVPARASNRSVWSCTLPRLVLDIAKTFGVDRYTAKMYNVCDGEADNRNIASRSGYSVSLDAHSSVSSVAAFLARGRAPPGRTVQGQPPSGSEGRSGVTKSKTVCRVLQTRGTHSVLYT